ncbi:sensor histidine kinase [Catellatospora methionotrophica]|uniref:sensor histidine kinase n=1 Tax=Catellatospora methionotrophica TaxID=121620 RepID=UPI0033E483C3
MNARAVRLPLTCWGALAATALAAGLVRADAMGSVGPQWSGSFLATYLVGVWALHREPGNRAALRLLVFGCVALTFLALSVELLVAVRGGIGGTAFVSANLVAQTVSMLFVCSQVATLVRYPDGVPLLQAERLLVGGLAVVALTLPLLLLLTLPDVVPAWIVQFSGESDGLAVPTVASPWHVPELGALGPAARFVNDGLLAVGPLLGVAVTALRYRRLDAVQRHRMAWPLQAALLLVLGIAFNAVAEAGAAPRLLGDAVSVACYVLLPVAMGIGIAAPNIFDALGTVRRTLSFAVLCLLIIGGYVAVAGLLGITVGGQDLRVAVIVAVLAALGLEPLRRTLVRRAGRIAFGHDVPRDELLRRLGDALENTMDRRALTESIARTVQEGLNAQWVLLQLTAADPVHVGRAVRPGEKPVLTSRLQHGPDDLGVICCGPSAGGGVTPRTRLQLDTLARQIALALTNARLADELNEQLTAVDASRQRLVTAEETARRRLERDLHDGAQQDLAALLTRIALARNQLGRSDMAKLDETLTTLQSDAGQTLKNLRELVSGIHESALADQGLVAAVEGRVAKSPIPVVVTCGTGVRDGRLAATVESAAYFTVCEALANTLKHGSAQQILIDLALDDGWLRVRITDDGRGFDPGRVGAASGLTGLRDRIAAVGGTLQVTSAPGAGATLTALVPARP